MKDNKLDLTKEYEIKEAIDILKTYSSEKFDPTVSVELNLNLDPKKNDQQLKGRILLPHGLGKDRKILAIVESQDYKKAKELGANWVGGEEFLEKIKNENWYEFDIIFTTPKMMQKFSKYGKVLGTKGYIPNVKFGNISPNLDEIKNLKSMQTEYKVDKFGNISLAFGKKSFPSAKLSENLDSIFAKIKQEKPNSLKGQYFQGAYISTSMGKGIKLKLKD